MKRNAKKLSLLILAGIVVHWLLEWIKIQSGGQLFFP